MTAVVSWDDQLLFIFFFFVIFISHLLYFVIPEKHNQAWVININSYLLFSGTNSKHFFCIFCMLACLHVYALMLRPWLICVK